jgi:hypothetical protein
VALGGVGGTRIEKSRMVSHGWKMDKRLALGRISRLSSDRGEVGCAVRWY